MSEYPKNSKLHGPTIKINYRHIDVLKDIVKQYNQNIHFKEDFNLPFIK